MTNIVGSVTSQFRKQLRLTQLGNDTLVGETIDSATKTLEGVQKELTNARIRTGNQRGKTGAIEKELEKTVGAAREENEGKMQEIAKEASNETKRLRDKGEERNAEILAATEEMSASSEEKVQLSSSKLF